MKCQVNMVNIDRLTIYPQRTIQKLHDSIHDDKRVLYQMKHRFSIYIKTANCNFNNEVTGSAKYKRKD